MKKSVGIHHITALASDPKRNFDFYTKVLGLRLVKKSINQDDPETYHFFFGNRSGEPGTGLTFFPHPEIAPGRAGAGQAVEVSFAIPKESLSFWMNRFHELALTYEGPETRFGESVIRVRDPDGLMIELVATESPYEGDLWTTDDVLAKNAIRGFHSTTLWVNDFPATSALLTTYLGFSEIAAEGFRHRFSTGQKGIGQIVDIRDTQGFMRGKPGAGTIHHVAFRAGSDEHELELRAELENIGLHITPVIDRYYFHSVYFREPNGILFEIATDEPGFTVDEILDDLGGKLQLPPRFEAMRAEIEANLPKVA
jgi:catechol 2,3-dioxygenase-like lactoylglutathione lyase family enzyme